MTTLPRRLRLTLALWLATLPCLHAQSVPATLQVLDPKGYHLGVDGLPEWDHFAGKKPHGRELTLHFPGKANATEQSLFIRQQDVKQSWEVRLNGRKLGVLDNSESGSMTPFAIPPGTLRDGDNTLAILPPKAVDDIVVGEFLLSALPLKEALGATLDVTVRDASNAAIPCRITIADERGFLAPVTAATNPPLAVRTGVIYTRDGRARFSVLPGTYTVYAGRGFEYSVATQKVAMVRGKTRLLELHISRDVPTPGFIAADTHIHNRTYSGHGDATIEEGMLTIAGEGIELAIATDHNHHTDYTEAALRMKVRDHFTSAVGNEVTTKAGHFNAYPVKPGSTLPNASLTNWTELLTDIRAKTGARVVQLNHPRDLHAGFVPLGQPHFNPVTGSHARLADVSFDAIEVVTSAALQSDPMLLFHDWFALLNRGRRVTGLGSSDTHYVSRMILGQGRSYIAADDTDPTRIDVNAAAQSVRDGRVLVSMGLLTTLRVDGRHTVGDLATKLGRTLNVEVTVLGPKWTEADRVQLFANGVLLRDEAIRGSLGKVEKAKFTWRLPKPSHDAHLVAVATGPGVKAPFWEIPRSYQPSLKFAKTHVIGATNPVWLDGDGDGRFTAARGYAEMLIAKHGTRAEALFPALGEYDEAVAAQAAGLLHARGVDLRSDAVRTALGEGGQQVRRGFEAVLKTTQQP